MSAHRKIVVVANDPETVETVRAHWAGLKHDTFVVLGNPLLDLHPSFCDQNTFLLIGVAQFRAFGKPLRRRVERARVSAKAILLLRETEVMDALDYVDLCDGFLFIDRQPERLNEIIDLAAQGYCMVPAGLLSVLASGHLRMDILSSLSSSEAAVLSLLGQGLTNKTIAQHLRVPDSKVKNDVRSILRKMHFRNRTEAGIFAFRHLATDRMMQADQKGGNGSN